MSDLTAKDILIKASEFLNEDNWTQRRFGRQDAHGHWRFCAVGAMQMVATGNPYKETVVVAKACSAVSKKLGLGLTNWNDNTRRTVWEVKDLLREVGEGLDE